MSRLSLFLVLLFSIAFLQCKKEPAYLEELDPYAEIASLIVNVGLCDLFNDPYCDFPIPIPNATVYLYESEEDLLLDDPVLEQKVTGYSGQVEFTQLEGSHIYYLKTICSYGTQESSENTPFRGIAYLEVLYEKP